MDCNKYTNKSDLALGSKGGSFGRLGRDDNENGNDGTFRYSCVFFLLAVASCLTSVRTDGRAILLGPLLGVNAHVGDLDINDTHAANASESFIMSCVSRVLLQLSQERVIIANCLTRIFPIFFLQEQF